jgi:hypothetical protein
MNDWIWIMVPLTALLIPIVVVFTKHQQRMAEIYHQGSAERNEIAALSNEIRELKALVHQQAITLDTLASTQKALSRPPASPDLTERLSTGP